MIYRTAVTTKVRRSKTCVGKGDTWKAEHVTYEVMTVNEF